MKLSCNSAICGDQTCGESMKVEKLVTVSAKIPEVLYAELAVRVPEGERSDFIREAIIEKLERTPRPEKILDLDRRIGELETDLSEIKRFLSDLEVLTFSKGKANPHKFCLDDVDHKIVDYLIHYKGATTPELAEALGVNRWLVLNRLRRIERSSKRHLGKEIISYYGGRKRGKKKAWWLAEDFTGEQE